MKWYASFSDPAGTGVGESQSLSNEDWQAALTKPGLQALPYPRRRKKRPGGPPPDLSRIPLRLDQTNPGSNGQDPGTGHGV